MDLRRVQGSAVRAELASGSHLMVNGLARPLPVVLRHVEGLDVVVCCRSIRSAFGARRWDEIVVLVVSHTCQGRRGSPVSIAKGRAGVQSRVAGSSR